MADLSLVIDLAFAEIPPFLSNFPISFVLFHRKTWMSKIILDVQD